MSEPTLRPIWTPDDYAQTVRDAERIRSYQRDAIAAEDMTPDVLPEQMVAAGVVEPDVLPYAPAVRHHAEPARRDWARIRRATLAALVVVLVLTVGALWAATRADADPPGMKCVDQFWLIPFQSNRRTICDGPIQSDGSWTRLREFYSPAHTIPARSSCYGGRYSSSCTYYPERFVPMSSQGVENYIVTPATVLHDEPGRIA